VHSLAFHWLHEIFILKRIHHRLEPEWEMRKIGCKRSTGCIMHWVHTTLAKPTWHQFGGKSIGSDFF
jgi:hypothetical protein